MDPTCVFNFFTFFERILYKSNCIIFIFSWCGTLTKIRSKLVVIATAGSQKITLWGPQRTPLGILRVNVFVQQSAYGRWGVTSAPCKVIVHTNLCSAAFLHHWHTSISDYSQYSMATWIPALQQNRAAKSHSALFGISDFVHNIPSNIPNWFIYPRMIVRYFLHSKYSEKTKWIYSKLEFPTMIYVPLKGPCVSTKLHDIRLELSIVNTNTCTTSTLQVKIY